MPIQSVARYVPRFNDGLKTWEILDRHRKTAFGRFDTKFQAGRRATQLQTEHNKRTAKDYGMRHPQPAPPARAYKDD